MRIFQAWHHVMQGPGDMNHEFCHPNFQNLHVDLRELRPLEAQETLNLIGGFNPFEKY